MLFGRKNPRPVVPGKMVWPRTPPKSVRIAAWCAAASFALLALGVVAVAWGCPPVDALHDHRPPQASLVFDREGKLLARLAPEERIVVPLSSVSTKLRSEERRVGKECGAG